MDTFEFSCDDAMGGFLLPCAVSWKVGCDCTEGKNDEANGCVCTKGLLGVVVFKKKFVVGMFVCVVK